jgi:hypothetical protein
MELYMKTMMTILFVTLSTGLCTHAQGHTNKSKLADCQVFVGNTLMNAVEVERWAAKSTNSPDLIHFAHLYTDSLGNQYSFGAPFSNRLTTSIYVSTPNGLTETASNAELKPGQSIGYFNLERNIEIKCTAR